MKVFFACKPCLYFFFESGASSCNRAPFAVSGGVFGFFVEFTMVMDFEISLIAASVLLPAAASASPLIRNSSLRVFAAVFFCGCMMLDSWLLFLTGNVFVSVRNLYLFVSAANFAFLAFSLFLAVRRRSYVVFLISLFEILMMCLFLFYKRYVPGNSTVILADTLGKMFIFAFSSGGGLFALLWIRYGNRGAGGGKGRLFSLLFLCISSLNFLAVSGNLFFVPSVINALALILYFVAEIEGSAESSAASLSVLTHLLCASLIFFAAAFFLYSYNGGEEGLSIVLLLKMGSLKSAGKVSIAVILMYVSAFICSGMPPFHGWLRKYCSVGFFSCSVFNVCAAGAGIFLIFRLAPSFPLLAYSGRVSGMIIGYSTAFFGAFVFFVCSCCACAQKTVPMAASFSLAGMAGLVVMCVGTGIPSAICGGLFLFVFHSLFGFVVAIAGFRSEDPVSRAVLKLSLCALYMPPFGVFFALWVILESLFNASFQYSGSALLLFSSSILPLSSAFVAVLGVSASFVSWTVRSACIGLQSFALKSFRLSGYSTALLLSVAFALCVNFSVPGLYFLVKRAAVDAMSPDASEPGIIVSMVETGFARHSFKGGADCFAGIYPSFQMLCVLGAAAVLFVLLCLRGRKGVVFFGPPSGRSVSEAWERVFPGRYARFLSEPYLDSFFTPASFVVLSYIIGVSSGVTFR